MDECTLYDIIYIDIHVEEEEEEEQHRNARLFYVFGYVVKFIFSVWLLAKENMGSRYNKSCFVYGKMSVGINVLMR